MPKPPASEDGEEALGSMGNDTPLACLSEQNRPVFDFFYQLFAQATGPCPTRGANKGPGVERWKPLEVVKLRLYMMLYGPSHCCDVIVVVELGCKYL